MARLFMAPLSGPPQPDRGAPAIARARGVCGARRAGLAGDGGSKSLREARAARRPTFFVLLRLVWPAILA